MPPDYAEVARRLHAQRAAGGGAPSPVPSPAGAQYVSGIEQRMGQRRTQQTAFGGSIEAAGEAMFKAAPHAASPRRINRAMLDLTEMEPRDRLLHLKKLKHVRQEASTYRRNLVGLMNLAARNGQKVTVGQAHQAIQESLRASPEKETSVLDSAIHALDTTGAYTRGAVAGRPGERVSPEAFNQSISEAAERGNVAAIAFKGVTDVVGGVVGASGGGLAGMAGIADDLMSDRPLDPERSTQLMRESGKTGADLLRTIVTDPLSWVSFGASGAAKNAATATLKATTQAAKAAGTGGQAALAFQRAEQLATVVGRIASKHGETKRGWALTRRAFKRFGFGEDLAKKTFGQHGDLLGASPMRLAVPFFERAGIDMPGAHQYLGRKALRGAYEPVRRFGEAVGGGKLRPLFDPEKRFLKSTTRTAKGSASMKESVFGRHVEKIAKMAPVKGTRRVEIVRTVIDPAEGVTKAQWQQAWRALDPDEQKWVKEINRFFGRRRNELVQAGVLGPEQIARNPVSKMYFPREYSPAFGFLEELGRVGKVGVKRGGKWVPSTAEFHKRTADLSGGQVAARRGLVDAAERAPIHELARQKMPLWWLKGRMDPLEVMPRYSQRAARAIAKAELEHSVAANFARAKASGDKSALKVVTKGLMTAGGKEVQIPADLYNILAGTFDDSYTTFSQFLRKNGVGETWRGRALLSTLNGYQRLSNRFKRNVLMPVPGYHVVNVMNDGIQSISDGNKGFYSFVNRADDALLGRGKGVEVATPEVVGGRVVMKKRRMAPDAFVAEAQSMNLPVSDVESLQRMDIPGQRGIARARDLEIMAEEASGKFGIRSRLRKPFVKGVELAEKAGDLVGSKLPGEAARATMLGQRGERFAGWWESRSKLAHYMWRRSVGDSPQEAARRTMEVLLDYGDRSRELQVARWFLPFATWSWKAPRMAGRAVLRRPGSVMGMERMVEALFEPEHKFEPRRYAMESGRVFELGEQGRKAVGNVRSALMAPERALGVPVRPGTGEVRPGFGAVMRPRILPFGESIAPWAELLGKGRIEPLAQMLGPMFGQAAELAMQRDMLTGAPLRRPGFIEGLMSLVPSGTGVAAGNLMPDAIAPYVQNAIKGVEALPGTNAWLSRYATQIAMNPLWKHAINSALFYGGGGPGAESPVAHLGRFRPTTGEPGLEQDILAQQRLGLLLRNPIMATTPLDQFWNLQQPGQPTFDAQAAYNILRRQARGVEQARLR